MGGHSHWAGIKHKKGILDAKRGKVFTKIVREITIAARLSGGAPENNPRLRKAIEDAKAENMPSENIKRAIQKGTGELPGAVIEELTYEGYGPGGIAVMVEVTTDSKNRTHSEIRKIFGEHGGNLGEVGCVGFLFKRQGYLTLKKAAVTEDKLMELALDAGAEDIRSDEAEVYEIVTPPESFDAVKKRLEDAKLAPDSSEITMLPTTEVQVDEKGAAKVMSLMDALEEHEDVKNVYSNFDIPDAVLARLG